MRALTTGARATLALALVSEPDTQFGVVSGLRIANRVYETETLMIEVSRHVDAVGADALEPLVAERQTRRKAPGLHR